VHNEPVSPSVDADVNYFSNAKHDTQLAEARLSVAAVDILQTRTFECMCERRRRKNIEAHRFSECLDELLPQLSSFVGRQAAEFEWKNGHGLPLVLLTKQVADLEKKEHREADKSESPRRFHIVDTVRKKKELFQRS
jgi:hypothetical protein